MQDKQAKLVRSGVDKLFSELGGKKAALIYSITDVEMKRKRSFAEKDFEILTPLHEDEELMLSWVKSLGIGWCCRKGLKPESPNQDSFSVLVVEDTFALYCVYDGHGPFGHDVSNFAREVAVKKFVQHRSRDDHPEKALRDSFIETHGLLEREPSIDSQMSGTTCTMSYHDMRLDKLIIAHVGDSRAVLGKAATCLELTVDHKPDLPEERARIEHANPPGRVVFDGFYNYRVFSQIGMYPGLNMSRALGDIVGHREAGLSAVPDLFNLDVKTEREGCGDGDLTLLLCTDGVWEFVKSQEAVELVNKPSSSAEDSMNKLAKESWDQWMKDSDSEISDDITGILVYLTRRRTP